jgi:hypothetical protein
MAGMVLSGGNSINRWEGGLLLGKSRSSGPLRWTTSCPATTAAQATSATQALCFRCNAGSAALREAGCVFCALEGSGWVLLENEQALHQPEWNAVVELLKQRRKQLSAKDHSISGWAGSLGEKRGG